jgi:Raf kinase inhibitor-like YbhB/YbcL family protein
MKHLLYTAAVAVALAAPLSVSAQAKPELTVTPEGIASDGYIGPDYAFCIPAATGHVKEGPDKSIGVSWSKGPEGTKSYAIVMVDTDVPASFDDAGKEGKTLPAGMERKSFYHWVLYDIPSDHSQIPAYTDSQGVVQHGKAELKTPYGTRGVNDYAPYFASDPARKGLYAGYDGPCPPWNDERIHHYHLKVFALDKSSLGLSGPVTGPQVMDAIAGHILAQGEVVGKYTLNPDVKK